MVEIEKSWPSKGGRTHTAYFAGVLVLVDKSSSLCLALSREVLVGLLAVMLDVQWYDLFQFFLYLLHTVLSRVCKIKEFVVLRITHVE